MSADDKPSDVVCVCGHAKNAHEHYRPGTECSLCADGECPRFRPARA